MLKIVLTMFIIGVFFLNYYFPLWNVKFLASSVIILPWTYITFLPQLMKELKSLKQIRGPDPNYNDICFFGDIRYYLSFSWTLYVRECDFYNLWDSSRNIEWIFCCSDDSKLSSFFPAVEMEFGNGQKLLLSPENYLFRVSYWLASPCASAWLFLFLGWLSIYS